MKGEVGFEANRPFQRARPYLKNRRSKKNNPGNTAGTSESNIIALEEKPEATTTMLHDAMDVDDADQTSRKRKRDTEDTSESGNPVAEAMIDPEALNVREPVQLMLEEAFFLNYVIGCLQIETVDKACKKVQKFFPASKSHVDDSCVSRSCFRLANFGNYSIQCKTTF